MLIELHILQNFSPSNLNRDDTGSPKECEFGGVRRARISSQCLKRAIRTTFAGESLLPTEDLAVRTKRLRDRAAADLVRLGRDRGAAERVVEVALGGVGLVLGSDAKTQYLLYLGERAIAGLVALCDAHWDLLAPLAGPAPEEADMAEKAEKGDKSESKKKGSAKDAKKAAKGALPSEIVRPLRALLDGDRASDLALFGRMLADLPEYNVDAACQVAHALSTNRLSQEFDFYTAVDDLKPDDTAGADMLGTVEFNSSCFYRYANVHVPTLRENLGGDDALARKTMAAFLHASIRAIPTGKQNSMAAHNPPSLVYAVVRDRAPWSLANAFLRPVRPQSDGDLVERSVAELDRYWGQLAQMYGEEGIRAQVVCTTAEDRLARLSPHRVDGVAELVERVLEAAWALEAAR